MTAESIQIISHAFCPPGVGHYAEHLKWQWASLTNYPPSVPTTLSVCFTGSDDATCERLSKMHQMILDGRTDPLVKLQTLQMRPSQLFRRAIGRNWLAKRSSADVVWFSDCDYLFGPDCLKTLAELAGRTSGLVMPQTILINKDAGNKAEKADHAVGDRMVADNLDYDLPQIDPSLFASRQQRICIGGCQIVGGNLAREIGYLDGTDYVQPVDEANGFLSCKCDRVWRHRNNLTATRLPIPNVYRIRHSRDGRDFTLTGENKGREVWK